MTDFLYDQNQPKVEIAISVSQKWFARHSSSIFHCLRVTGNFHCCSNGRELEIAIRWRDPIEIVSPLSWTILVLYKCSIDKNRPSVTVTSDTVNTNYRRVTHRPRSGIRPFCIAAFLDLKHHSIDLLRYPISVSIGSMSRDQRADHWRCTTKQWEEPLEVSSLSYQRASPNFW